MIGCDSLTKILKEMSDSNIIRKIVIGIDPKDAMAYYLGMRAGGGEVHAIVHDEAHLSRG